MADPPLRLVIADNDEAVLELLRLDLSLEGHDIVASASNGEEAVRLCEELAPDVLVVDYRLGPGLNGVDVAGKVERPRVVLFTNYINATVIAEATRAGAVVIEKGNLNALRRAVEGGRADNV